MKIVQRLRSLERRDHKHYIPDVAKDAIDAIEETRDALSELKSAVSDCLVENPERFPGPIVSVDVRRKDLINLRDQHKRAQEVLRKWFPEQ